MPPVDQAVLESPDPFRQSEYLVDETRRANSDRSHLGIPADDTSWSDQLSAFSPSNDGSWEILSRTSHSPSICLIETEDTQQTQSQQTLVLSNDPLPMDFSSPIQMQQASEPNHSSWPHENGYISGFWPELFRSPSQQMQSGYQDPYQSPVAAAYGRPSDADSYDLNTFRDLYTATGDPSDLGPNQADILGIASCSSNPIGVEVPGPIPRSSEPAQSGSHATIVNSEISEEFERSPGEQTSLSCSFQRRNPGKVRKPKPTSRARVSEVDPPRKKRKSGLPRENLHDINAVRKKKACLYCRIEHEKVSPNVLSSSHKSI